MKLLPFLALPPLASCAMAPMGISTPADSPLLTGLDEAAYYALLPLRDAHAHNEQAGALLQSPEGKYSYTVPLPQLRDSFTLHVRVPPGWKLAGIYHTHPGDDKASQVFSPEDLDMAKRLGLPSYILFQGTGEIRKYVPGQTRTGLTLVTNEMKRTAAGDPPAPAVAQVTDGH